VSLSLRDAIHQANITTGTQEIWLPAWKFYLSRDRATYGGGSLTDTSVAYGDLDIDGSLVIRGIDSVTNVAWLNSVPSDSVFELLGDADRAATPLPDGGHQYQVTSADATLCANTQGSPTDFRADVDEDGNVDADDLAIINARLNNTLLVYSILGV
jgi:hypothetical protein